MARKTRKSETLSSETPEVQEALLGEILDNETPAIVEDPEAGEIEIKKVEIEKPVKDEDLKVGDKVKINKGVTVDTLGRRIHNGIRNYTYKVLNVRSDDYVSVECLTYAFLVHKTNLTKI